MHKPQIFIGAGSLLLLFIGFSCSRDVRLAGKDIPENIQAKTVTHYGQVLDESATPQQVAYVLLRALKEDFQADSPKSRAVALGIQFDACAPQTIVSSLPSILTRDELLYRVVYRWSPTVGHYAKDIGTSFEPMKDRMMLRGLREAANHSDGAKECKILVELADPSNDPNAAVVLGLAMIQENNLWRVSRLAFAPTIRSLAGLSVTKKSNK